MKRIIVFTAMFAACLAQLTAEEFPNKKCREIFGPAVINSIACANGQCGGTLAFWSKNGRCDVDADTMCYSFVVPTNITYPAMSVNVGPGMGFCGANNDLICLPEFSNGVTNWPVNMNWMDCM